MSFKRCISVFDNEGRFNPAYDEDDVLTIDADTVIFAIGQGGDNAFVDGVCKLSDRGILIADPVTQQTSNPKFSRRER